MALLLLLLEVTQPVVLKVYFWYTQRPDSLWESGSFMQYKRLNQSMMHDMQAL